MTWELAEAKARLEEVLETSLREGAQVVTSGAGEFIVLSREEWAKSKRRTAKEDGPVEAPQSLREWLLAEEPKVGDMMIPDRRDWRFRTPP